MEPFTDHGTFWLPEGERTGGRVEFDGDAVLLTLDGPLDSAEDGDHNGDDEAQQLLRHALIHAELRDHGAASILDASAPVHGGHRRPIRWRAPAAVIGEQLSQARFIQTWVRFDALVAWAKPRPLMDWAGHGTRTATVDLDREVLASAVVGDVRIELVSAWERDGRVSEMDVRMSRICSFAIKTPPLSWSDIFDKWIRPLQDLLIVLLGKPVRMTRCRTLPVDPDDSRQSCELVIGAHQPPLSDTPTPLDLLNWGQPTMLTRDELSIPVEDLIDGWYGCQGKFADSITLLCSSFYAPFMYSEHQFSTLIQGVENLGDVLFGSQQLEAAEHEVRVNAILDAATTAGVAEDHVGWAKRCLENANHQPLKTTIEKLLAATGGLGQAIIEQDPKFAVRLAGFRGRIAHGKGWRGLDSADLYWHSEALRWLIRAQLAMAAGVPIEALWERVEQRGHFTQALPRLAAQRPTLKA